MFELIVVFSALTTPVPVPVQPPIDISQPPAIVVVARPSGTHSVAASSAATSISHSVSNEPVAAARLARAYQ